jgi:dTDP-4-amino-4,6-dideoxygalactose transaminase
MWACGVGRGTEIIAPTLTYWASSLPALSLGATINFADVLPDTLCIDPADIEHRIGRYTRAIVVVHNHGYPCDMRPIMAIARRHKIKVIEDVSHAHGGLYRGQLLGSIGDVGCMSMMSGKAFPTGEAGMLVTNDRRLWERATAFGHYERTGKSNFAKGASVLTDPALIEFAGLPQGGSKHRINQLCSAMGLTQLAQYPRRMAEIQKAMNCFWDFLEGVPGIRAHRTAKNSGSTMGGWYSPVGHYVAEELGGLAIEKFVQAVRAEGGRAGIWGEFPLHLHPLLQTADIYGDGKPTVVANAHRDVRQGPGSLPVAEGLKGRVLWTPWFKHHRPRQIKQYAQAIRKVCEHYANS